MVSKLLKRTRNASREMVEKISDALGLKGSRKVEFFASAGFIIDDEDGSDKTEEIIRIIDPDEVRMVKYLRGVPPELRQSAINAVESYKTAGDLLRERQEANTIGKRADRHENPSISEKSPTGDSDDALGTDE